MADLRSFGVRQLAAALLQASLLAGTTTAEDGREQARGGKAAALEYGPPRRAAAFVQASLLAVPSLVYSTSRTGPRASSRR